MLWNVSLGLNSNTAMTPSRVMSRDFSEASPACRATASAGLPACGAPQVSGLPHHHAFSCCSWKGESMRATPMAKPMVSLANWSTYDALAR